jgi:hypothetical protein
MKVFMKKGTSGMGMQYGSLWRKTYKGSILRYSTFYFALLSHFTLGGSRPPLKGSCSATG